MDISVTGGQPVVIFGKKTDIKNKVKRFFSEISSVQSSDKTTKTSGTPVRKVVEKIDSFDTIHIKDTDVIGGTKVKYGGLWAENCTFGQNVEVFKSYYCKNVTTSKEIIMKSQFGSGNLINSNIGHAHVFLNVNKDEASSIESFTTECGRVNIIATSKNKDSSEKFNSAEKPRKNTPLETARSPSPTPAEPKKDTSGVADKGKIVISGVKMFPGKVLLTSSSIINNQNITKDNLSGILQKIALENTMINPSESPVEFFFDKKLVVTYYKNIPSIKPPAKPANSTISVIGFGQSTNSVTGTEIGSSNLAKMCGLFKDNDGVKISYLSRNSEQPPTSNDLFDLVRETYRKGFNVLLGSSKVDIYLDNKHVVSYMTNLSKERPMPQSQPAPAPEPDISAFESYRGIKSNGLKGNKIYFDRKSTIGGVPVTRDNLADLAKMASENNLTIIDAPTVEYFYEDENVFTWFRSQQS